MTGIALPQSRKPLVDLVVAARPNFMKIAPLFRCLQAGRRCSPRLVHTGQHYDDALSGWFLRDLGLPAPHESLDVGSGTHAEQTAGVMVRYEALCSRERPDWLIVPGDVNSTMACAIAAKKLGIRVIHLEAGLRSFDRTMPEEINRVLTDAISDVLWTPSPDADENLAREGVRPDAIVRIGNTMIDSLELMRPHIEAASADLPGRARAVVTLHRPANVDNPDVLGRLVEILAIVSCDVPLVFPLHPRTLARLREADLLGKLERAANIDLVEPLGYVEFMARVLRSPMVITDSGGVQEETTYLGIPCLTLRPNTERPVTITIGTNRLVTPEGLLDAVRTTIAGERAPASVPDLWDGRAAERAAAHFATLTGT